MIPPVRLVADGRAVPDVMALILANSRTPDEREGDLRAQLAAHRLADRRLAEVAERHGADTVREAFAALLEYAERRTRAAIDAMPDGRYEAAEALEGDGVTEDDLWIRVAVTIDGERMRVDFAGTDPAGPGNCNCPLAVTRSAVYFVVRAVTDPDIPASAGAFAPVEVVAPDRLAGQRRAALRRRRRQRGDQQPHRRRGVRGPRRRHRGARPGPGDHEQRDPGRAGADLLRDARRRPGRVARRRRPLGRARGHEQHAEHPGGGARDRVPGAGGGLPAAARLRRGRPPPRRRRRRAAPARAGRAGGLGDRRAPPARAGRPRRRRRRGARTDHPQRRRAALQVARAAGGRRRAGHRDAGRRRARPASSSTPSRGHSEG